MTKPIAAALERFDLWNIAATHTHKHTYTHILSTIPLWNMTQTLCRDVEVSEEVDLNSCWMLMQIWTMMMTISWFTLQTWIRYCASYNRMIQSYTRRLIINPSSLSLPIANTVRLCGWEFLSECGESAGTWSMDYGLWSMDHVPRIPWIMIVRHDFVERTTIRIAD